MHNNQKFQMSPSELQAVALATLALAVGAVLGILLARAA